MTDTLELPPLYESVVRETAASAVGEARALACDGADEGTLVWVREERSPQGRFAHEWFTCSGNLGCALVMRPDYPIATAWQLGYVAGVSLFCALASLAQPGMALTYRWPNDVLMNESKVATVSVHTPLPAGDRFAWMVLGVSANLTGHPEHTPFPATSVAAEQGELDFGAVELLTAFARHFLVWANRWAEEGLAPIRQAWLPYAQATQTPIALRLRDDTVVHGRLGEIDERGYVTIEQSDGIRRELGPADFWH